MGTLMAWLSNLSGSANCAWNIPSNHTSLSPHSPSQPLHSHFRISNNSHLFNRLCFYINTSCYISKFHRWLCEMLREHLQTEGVFSNSRMLPQPQLRKHFQDKGRESCWDKREKQKGSLWWHLMFYPQSCSPDPVPVPASPYPGTGSVF